MKNIIYQLVTAATTFASITAAAAPSINVNDAIFNISTGETITVSLSGVTSPIGGVNFSIVLPEGMSASAQLTDSLLEAGFTLDYISSNSFFTAVFYSTEANIEIDGEILELYLEYDSSTIHVAETLDFASEDLVTGVNSKHALSNSDGSESLEHDLSSGQLFLISNTSDYDNDGIADPHDDDIDGDGVSNSEEIAANQNPIDPTDNQSGFRYAFADYDGDGKADVWARNTVTFTNFIRDTESGNIHREVFGMRDEDIPVLGDYDGDGRTDIAFRRPSTKYWYIKNSSGVDLFTENSDGITRKRFGLQSTDLPVPADYNGDGITDIAFRRPSNKTWVILNSPGAAVNFNDSNDDGIQEVIFGSQEEDIPVPCDYNGDGIADIAVRRPSTQFWYIKNSPGDKVNYNSDREDGIQRIRFGLQSGDIPVPGDYDNDGICDLAVRRPSNQHWYIKRSSDGNIIRANFGLRATDIPIPADYDGDGATDIAVRRPSSFWQYILNSADQTIGRIQFGMKSSYIPMQAPVHVVMDFMSDGNVSNRVHSELTDAIGLAEMEFYNEQVELKFDLLGPGYEEDISASQTDKKE